MGLTYQADSLIFVIIGAAMAFLGAAMAFLGAAILTFLFGIPKEEQAAAETSSSTAASVPEPVKTASAANGQEISIASPIKGKVIPLSEVPDEAFASEAMGKGIGIVPMGGKFMRHLTEKLKCFLKPDMPSGFKAMMASAC